MSLPKLNLHIHTTYSDGKNTINQIVKTAIKLVLDYICITDHFSNSWKSKIIPTLNNLDKIERYLEEISHCQAYISKKKEN
jgi:histidinol phosphatase-like PHP family hydrolase